MVAVDPVEFKRAKALKFGATHAVATSEETHAPVTDLTSWMRIFPGTVQPEDTVSEELRALPLPQGPVHTLQRELLAKYHVDEPREFFTTNAFWSVPSDPTVEENLDQRPFHVLVGDQHSAEPSFQLASAMVGFNREFPLRIHLGAFRPRQLRHDHRPAVADRHPHPRSTNRSRTR